MSKNSLLKRLFAVSTFALMFGAVSAHAQSSSGSSSSLGDAATTTENAAGKTEANREGRMSPTGQNATTSVGTPRTRDTSGESSSSGSSGSSSSMSGQSSSGSSGSLGGAATTTENAAGKTKANREGRMSPSGQNETTSVGTPRTRDSSGGSSSSGASGASGSTSGSSSSMSGQSSSGGSSSGSSSSLGDAATTTENAAGKTKANREGRMSPTGQNATTSVGTPRTRDTESSTSKGMNK